MRKRGPWWKRLLGALDLTARQWRTVNATMRLVDALLTDGVIAPPVALYRTTRGTCDVCCEQIEGVCDCAEKPSVIVGVTAPTLAVKNYLIWIARNGQRSWNMTDFDLAVRVWGLVKVYQFNERLI